MKLSLIIPCYNEEAVIRQFHQTTHKLLHKPNTNTPGLVFPTQEKNIKIKKQAEVIQKLLNGYEK